MIAFSFLEYCAWLARAMARDAEVTLYLPRVEADPVADQVGPAVDLRLFDQPRLRQPVPCLRLTGGIVRDIRRGRPDVVHLQAGHLYMTPLLPAIGDRALVMTCHDVRPHLGDQPSRKVPSFVLDWGLRRADAVIVHGESLRRLAGEVCRVPLERIHVVPHHWQSEPARPAAAAAGNGSTAPQSILFFGRIWPYKGLEYLIRAQPRVSARVPQAEFVIAGEGEDLARYRAMMAQPERFVVHDGFVPREERARLLDRASVVVLPYLEATQSGVVPLAWAHGRAVVASRVGAIPEVVEHDRTGLLVPPGDPHALADAIVRVLGESGLAARLGAAGRDKLRAEMSPETAAEATLAVYGTALEHRRARR